MSDLLYYSRYHFADSMQSAKDWCPLIGTPVISCYIWFWVSQFRLMTLIAFGCKFSRDTIPLRLSPTLVMSMLCSTFLILVDCRVATRGSRLSLHYSCFSKGMSPSQLIFGKHHVSFTTVIVLRLALLKMILKLHHRLFDLSQVDYSLSCLL